MTATQYLTDRGYDVEKTSVETLKRLGATAARLGYARKLQAMKVRDGGFVVHTWPREVWEAAEQAMASGETGPARPASQRQVGYLMMLACERGEGSEFLKTLDNELSEDAARKLIETATRGH